MIENKLSKCEPDDPHRCQAINNKKDQCNYISYYNEEAEKYEKYCIKHNGSINANNENAKSIRNYRFIKYQDRINHFADNDHVKSLREEIGILRMIMEETVNKCENQVDIMIYSPKITDLCLKIERVVVSCHKLESSLGQTLDKTAVLNMATRFVNIISESISDQTIIDKIVEDIGNLIKE